MAQNARASPSNLADSPTSSPTSSCPASADPLEKLLRHNKLWAEAKKTEEPGYFNKLCQQQSPEYFWIGCADSRVPANVILGLEPGEVFVQRNVGNQATHTDLNCMSCLEYAVKELQVRCILVCGHYNCGAVKGALKLPSKTQNLVNCWISDIRECRNQHREVLMDCPSTEDQVDRLCELNVLRQAFHVCTSPVVQAAWDKGQDLVVYGIIYSLKDGLIRKLVGPLKGNGDFPADVNKFESRGVSYSLTSSLGRFPILDKDELASRANTQAVTSKLQEHNEWASHTHAAHTNPADEHSE